MDLYIYIERERETETDTETERERQRQNTLPQTAEYTFFLSAYRTFSRIDLMLGHKTSLSKFNIEIISSIFSAHNTMRLEINYKKKKNCMKHKQVEAKQYATKQPVGH